MELLLMSMVYKIRETLIFRDTYSTTLQLFTLLPLIMQFTWCFVAALLGGSAFGSALAGRGCPNGPYRTGTLCSKACADYKRCGNDNHVVRYVGVVIYTATITANLPMIELSLDNSITALCSKHLLTVVQIQCQPVAGLYYWIEKEPCGHCKWGKCMSIQLPT
jgi:hypothetical protein